MKEEEISIPTPVEADRKTPWDEMDEKPEGIVGLIKETRDILHKIDEREQLAIEHGKRP